MTVKRNQLCRHLKRLHEMVADRPLSDIPTLAEVLFDRLVAFEAEAKAGGASAETLGAISNARFMAGIATLCPWFPVPRGH
ncbi:hypothetical protein [Methylobacterium sp. ARG-1]|uniref:hypothetical protein n=1 Tax=Methylobacterium sp. ARG-1 TaxID=1692501 RepID=UPI00067F9F8D|nr:hypothetical protein [Methylobacterium sp. ARG-1]KNY23072.1 hypothetical protein AKJ13_09355 [Methylobacterium sp. ARG-1]